MLSDKTLKVSYAVAAMLCVSAFLYVWFTDGKFEIVALLATGLCLVQWYRLQHSVKANLNKLIIRSGNEISISNHQVGYTDAPKTLAVQRISEFNIGDKYLSVILDNNGLGYDFVISGTQQQIKTHLQQIFSQDEQSAIRFNLV